MKRILYILIDDNKNEITFCDAKNVHLTLIKGQRTYVTHGFFHAAAKYHTAYIDASLKTTQNQGWIDSYIKPMCDLPEGEGIIFI